MAPLFAVACVAPMTLLTVAMLTAPTLTAPSTPSTLSTLSTFATVGPRPRPHIASLLAQAAPQVLTCAASPTAEALATFVVHADGSVDAVNVLLSSDGVDTACIRDQLRAQRAVARGNEPSTRVYLTVANAALKEGHLLAPLALADAAAIVKDDLKRCQTQAISRVGQLDDDAVGDVVVALRAHDGKVNAAHVVHSTVRSPRLHACVIERLLRTGVADGASGDGAWVFHFDPPRRRAQARRAQAQTLFRYLGITP